MGLDQYAFARKDGVSVELMYWRKHADLEGWMSNLYMTRGGRGDFNCVELKLFEADLDRLTEEYQDLEEARGFFWGGSHSEDDEPTSQFLTLAYEKMRDGYEIIYTSWW